LVGLNFDPTNQKRRIETQLKKEVQLYLKARIGMCLFWGWKASHSFSKWQKQQPTV
jgi:hypothetical protein